MDAHSKPSRLGGHGKASGQICEWLRTCADDPAGRSSKAQAQSCDWHILWEVEKWANQQHNVTPDIDPYLLKHVTGSLYAVIAEWDLTNL